MAKDSNWIWWTIGGVSLLGLGVGAYIFFKDRKEKKAQAESESNAATTTTPTITSSSSTTSSSSSSSNTPFKNEAEGNAFRGWVNDNFSDYARSIDLDRTGKFNNATIKKAWKQHGSAYINRGSSTNQSVTSDPTRTLESIAASLRDGGLVKDVEIDNTNNRVRAFAYDGFGYGSNNIYVNMYPNGTLYFEDGNDKQKKSGTFSGASPNLTIQVEGAKSTGKGGIIVNELAKALYGKSSFGFNNSSDLDRMMYNSKVSFVDINDANL
jgi:hypothetical protein